MILKIPFDFFYLKGILFICYKYKQIQGQLQGNLKPWLAAMTRGFHFNTTFFIWTELLMWMQQRSSYWSFVFFFSSQLSELRQREIKGSGKFWRKVRIQRKIENYYAHVNVNLHHCITLKVYNFWFKDYFLEEISSVALFWIQSNSYEQQTVT